MPPGFSPLERSKGTASNRRPHMPQGERPAPHHSSHPRILLRPFENGLGFYDARRDNGKTVHLIVYLDEAHGLRGMANRKRTETN